MKRNKINILVFLLVLTVAILITAPASAADSCGDHLGGLAISGCITNNGNGTVTGTVWNNTDSYQNVGIASYYKYSTGQNATLRNQEYYAHQVGAVAPQSSITFVLGIPGCLTQVDLFVGDVIYTFTAENELYGTRLITASHYNSEPCDPGSGQEGCTPGYWKNHNGFWSQKARLYVNVFFGPLGWLGGGDPALRAAVTGAIGDLTLDNALSYRGNRNRFEALLRSSAAGLLSATHPEVEYPLSAEEVVQMTRSAWQAWLVGDYTSVETYKNTLDNSNNLGCDLGRYPYP